MFKIKQQLRRLYAVTAISSLQIAGASWVALLAARGFSLAEIGLAEGVLFSMFIRPVGHSSRNSFGKLILNFLTCSSLIFRFFEYLKVKNETDFFRQFYIFITTHQNVRSFFAPE